MFGGHFDGIFADESPKFLYRFHQVIWDPAHGLIVPRVDRDGPKVHWIVVIIDKG